MALLAAPGALAPGCGGDDAAPAGDAGPPDTPLIIRCEVDQDGDLISNAEEGFADPDGDGIPNYQDRDSDGDGIPDANEAGDMDCSTPAVDTDGDGTPDYLDTDSNGDGIPDRDQRTGDMDSDGIPDYRDPDVDGDGIDNATEFGPGPMAADSDLDGIPDVIDEDSDGDTILDAHEHATDQDGDGIPNYLDLDSDGDGIDDALEAGDGDPATPPAVCPNEVNPIDGMTLESDGLADFLDFDSDNDGLSDGEEAAIGTDPCNIDSDMDGVSDLVEGAYARLNCPDGMTGTGCGCATSAGCTIPSGHFYVVLPFGGPPVERDLDFGTTLRRADVFFLTDTTGSMRNTLNNVKTTVGAPGTGLIDRVSIAITDAWFGGGQHDDFPFSPFGRATDNDEPFKLAIRMTPPTLPGMPAGSGRDAVSTAFGTMGLHFGDDTPEAHTEALYQIMTGLGGTWTRGAESYTMPAYVGDCLDMGWGAPCFRDDALPIIVHFTDVCAHQAPGGEAPECAGYTGITPAPTDWATMIAAMNARGARYIGINTWGGVNCADAIATGGSTACYFMNRTAQDTGTVDLAGNELVYDLPNGGSTTAFADTVVAAIETVATRVPFQIDTRTRDDLTDPGGIDATRFIKRRQPSCVATPPSMPCWWEPMGITHAAAVAAIDQSTFFAVVPGTRVQFRITFQNDFLPNGTRAKLFIAYIDVRADGSAILDTRQVFIVVPADRGDLLR